MPDLQNIHKKKVSLKWGKSKNSNVAQKSVDFVMLFHIYNM